MADGRGSSFVANAKSLLAPGFAGAVGSVPAGAAWHFADGDPVSSAFVGLAGVIFYASVLYLWGRSALRSAPLSERGRAAASDDVQQRLRALGTLRTAPDGGASLRVPAAEALRLHPQLISDATHLGAWLPQVQAVLISLGLVGTFVGLSMGLMDAVPCIDPNDPGFAACADAAAHAGAATGELAAGATREAAALRWGMSALLGGARLAFSKSIAGVGLGVVYMLLLRHVEHSMRARRRATVEEVLRAIPVYSDMDQLSERIVNALSSQQELGAAAGALAASAIQISSAVEPLAGVATRLSTVSADAIGEKVGVAVEAAVKQVLSPTLSGIRTELVAVQRLVEEVQRHKVAQDEVVTARLKELTDELRTNVLAPMSAEVRRASVQIHHAAQAINQLAPLLEQTHSTISDSTRQTAQLSADLSLFQERTLEQLRAHGVEQAKVLTEAGVAIRSAVDAAVDGLRQQEAAFQKSAKQAEQTFAAQVEAVRGAGVASATAIENAGAVAAEVLTESGVVIRSAVDAAVEGLRQQEAAFHKSSRQAEQTFAAQVEAVRGAGDASATAIENAGAGAAKVLKEVKDTLVVGVQEQIDGLGRLLRGLKELTASVAITDQGQRDALNITAQRTSDMLRELSELARGIWEAADAARAERLGVTATMNQLVKEHAHMLQTESQALATAVTHLYEVVNLAEQRSQRAAHGVGSGGKVRRKAAEGKDSAAPEGQGSD
jgi:hypothetical protein